MNNLINKVKEVKETEDIQLVNSLVEQNWILLKIVSNENKTTYSLGRIEDNVILNKYLIFTKEEYTKMMERVFPRTKIEDINKRWDRIRKGHNYIIGLNQDESIDNFFYSVDYFIKNILKETTHKNDLGAVHSKTINQKRIDYGLDPIENGNTLLCKRVENMKESE